MARQDRAASAAGAPPRSGGAPRTGATGRPPDPSTATRDEAARLADHASIDRLAQDLLPALIAKLGASGLGEIEVREGDWRVRLRRPADGAPASAGAGRRQADRAGRAPAGRTTLTPVGPGRLTDEAGAEPEGWRHAGDSPVAGRDPYRAMATSPAVGFFRPLPGVVAGSRVRAGDAVASIDVLGIPQEVVAPADGIIGASLVEPGEAVEYGQELLWVELLSTAPPADPSSAPADPTPADPAEGER